MTKWVVYGTQYSTEKVGGRLVDHYYHIMEEIRREKITVANQNVKEQHG
jgi:hypothetical protein